MIWERDRGWYTTAPFSEPEVFDFPEGIGPVECVNVEHEEVLLVPRWVDCRRVTFKYGLGDEFIEVLRTLHKLGLDSKEPIRVKGVEVAPRDVVAAALPDPATLGDRMSGKTCAGTLVTGTGIDGRPRKTYLYHVVDNEWSMREYGSQAVVWQTALNPVVALELLSTGAWSGVGVLGPGGLPRAAVPREARRARVAARRPRARPVTPPSAGYPRRMETAGKVLLGIALVLALLGVGALVLARLGVDRLPLTIHWKSDNVSVFVPVGLMVVVSIVATIVLNVLLRR